MAWRTVLFPDWEIGISQIASIAPFGFPPRDAVFLACGGPGGLLCQQGWQVPLPQGSLLSLSHPRVPGSSSAPR